MILLQCQVLGAQDTLRERELRQGRNWQELLNSTEGSDEVGSQIFKMVLIFELYVAATKGKIIPWIPQLQLSDTDRKN